MPAPESVRFDRRQVERFIRLVKQLSEKCHLLHKTTVIHGIAGTKKRRHTFRRKRNHNTPFSWITRISEAIAKSSGTAVETMRHFVLAAILRIQSRIQCGLAEMKIPIVPTTKHMNAKKDENFKSAA